MLFYKFQSFWSFNDHEWTNIPNSHYKRHCIKIYTCWNVTTIRQLNRPPEVNITLIIQNLVLFFHWMQPNTLNFMQYFSAKTKIISLSFTLWVWSDPCMQFCWKCVLESKQNFKLTYFPKYSIFLLKHPNCTDSRAQWFNPGQKFPAFTSFSMENHP